MKREFGRKKVPRGQVKAKKSYGQHFLKDEGIAESIANGLSGHGGYDQVIEVGPGMGVLTKYLTAGPYDVTAIELDRESVDYLLQNNVLPQGKIIEGDFLRLDFASLPSPVGLIGNFPYNISSQIFFKALDHKDQVTEVVGMIQKEVAERIAAPPGNKTYGILSVLLQAYFTVEYLFTVPPDVFIPPPKVTSAVIALRRNDVKDLGCSFSSFKSVVKQGFNNRRKTLRNAIRSLLPETPSAELMEFLSKRAEQLSVQEFVRLTNLLDEEKSSE